MMLKIFMFVAFCPLISASQSANPIDDDRVISTVDSIDASNMVLKQAFTVGVSLDAVWDAYTTKTGWENWAVAKAEVDFRIGGLIQTSYDTNIVLGEPGTIKLHVINYIPKTMITLQAELTENFPEFMVEDAEQLFNIITFESLSSTETRVVSYGIGYKKSQKYIDLMKFFITGNESSYYQLISYLELGKTLKN